MKRVLGILVGASLALSIGCAESYDLRVEDTIKNMVYRRDLDKNTEAPPSKSNLENAKIYIRSPKGVKLAQSFALVVEPGKFDVTDTFIDPDKGASLHILARTNAPKAATPKKGPNPSEATEPPAAAAARGDFTTDVVDLIKSAYSTELDAVQLKPTEPNSHGRKGISYRSTTLEANNKEVKVYFYGAKTDPAQVALIFEGPKESIRSLSSQIDYSLNSLALGSRASSLYNGGDELAGDEGAATPSGVGF